MWREVGADLRSPPVGREVRGRAGRTLSPPSRGFCFFNSVAIACRQLQQHGKASKILIVDWVGPGCWCHQSRACLQNPEPAAEDVAACLSLALASTLLKSG